MPDGNRPALHNGSAAPDVLDAVFKREYPELLDVNLPRYEAGMSGFDNNCTRCVVAADHTLSGAPSSAMPSLAASANDVSQALGGHWTSARSYDDIVGQMEALGEGARGVVLLDRGPGVIGHVFNVIFDKTVWYSWTVRLAGFATLETPYAGLLFLKTAGGTP